MPHVRSALSRRPERLSEPRAVFVAKNKQRIPANGKSTVYSSIGKRLENAYRSIGDQIPTVLPRGSRNTFAPFREALPTVSPPAFCAVPIVMAEEEVPSIVDMENIPARTFTVLSSAMESVPSKNRRWSTLHRQDSTFPRRYPASDKQLHIPGVGRDQFSPSPRIVMACPLLIMIVSPPTKSIFLS